MNKNVKRIIAMAVAIGTASAVAPATSINLFTTKVYAATTNTYTTLDSLKLTSSSGSNIKLYSDSGYGSSDKVDDDEISPDDTYYAKTSSDTINVEIDGPSTKYVRVFKGTSSSTKGKKISSDISISDTTTIVIKVYGEEPDSDVRYDDDTDYDILNTYKIKVKYTGSDSSSSSDSSADDYDDIYLDKITIDGDDVNISESEVNYSYNVASDVDEVTIKAVPEDEDEDTVEIDGNDVDSSDKYKQTVSLDKGENKIEIKVTNDNDDERVYTLKINRGTSTSNTTSTTTADDYDSIYLDKVSVDGNTIELSKSKINYSYKVASDVNEVIVRAVPEDEDEDTVEVNDDEVDSSDKYKKTVSLVKGDNKIKIDLTNQDDEERIYTLNITRGTSTADTTTTTTAVSSPSTATDVTPAKVSQWVQTNGVWRYNDATGNAVKNSWIQNYYVQADGSMATGWLSNNGGWYYLGTDGAKKIGWQTVNGVWYYLDSSVDGKMKIGWMKDTNGKYYYLNSDGSMAHNITIQGYKLGSDGAWIK